MEIKYEPNNDLVLVTINHNRTNDDVLVTFKQSIQTQITILQEKKRFVVTDNSARPYTITVGITGTIRSTYIAQECTRKYYYFG